MATRKLLARLTAAALLTEVLFPPFEFNVGYRTSINLGYGFLLVPPAYEGHAGSVNVELLALELLATIAAGLLWIRFVAGE